MKKLLGILVMVSWCSVGFAEIIKLGNCNYTLFQEKTGSDLADINKGYEELAFEKDFVCSVVGNVVGQQYLRRII
jgi:hypothetical protein